MSQVTQATPIRASHRAQWIAAVSALLALLATAAVVLVVAIDGGSPDTSAPVAQQSQPVVRAQSGPDESAVAASVAPRPSLGPDESRTASAIGGPR